MWQKGYSDPDWGSYVPADVLEIPGIGYFIAFNDEWYDLDQRPFLLHINTIGDVVWNKTFGAGNIFTGMTVDSTGNIVLCGRYNYSPNPQSAWIIKTDQSGAIIWQKRYTPENGGAYDIEPIAGGGFMVIASGSRVFRIDDSGGIVWAKTITPPIYGGRLIPATGGGFIIATANSTDRNDGLMKISADGTMLWSKAYDPTPWHSSDWLSTPYYVRETPDHGLLLGMSTVQSEGPNLVMKLDSTGELNTSCPIAITPSWASLSTSTMSSSTTSVSAVSNPIDQSTPPAVLNDYSQSEHTLCTNFAMFSIVCEPYEIFVDRGGCGRANCTISSFEWFGQVALSCTGLPAGGSCSFLPGTIDLDLWDSDTSDLSITVSSGEPLGSTYFQVVGTSDVLSNSFEMLATISVLDPAPNPVDFGGIDAGQTTEETIVVSNITTSDIIITSITSPTTPFFITGNTCSNALLHPAESCTVDVAFWPEEIGLVRGLATISTSEGSKVDLCLEGIGLEPAITLDLVTPEGGETWPYSPDMVNRNSHYIIWEYDYYFELSRTQLSYSTDGGVTWTVIADSDLGQLAANAVHYLWSLPTVEEAAAAGQTLPSSTVRVRIETWGQGDTTATVESANFYLVKPTTTSVQTLILWHSARIAASYGTTARDELSLKLAEFADHETVVGVVLDLDAVPSIGDAFTCWDRMYDGDPANDFDPPCASASADPQTRANDTAGLIRDYLIQQVTGTYSNVRFLVLVGDDRQIPFRRMADGISIHDESIYPASVGLNTTTTVGSALAAGYFLSDNYYSEFAPEPSGLNAPHDLVYLNDLYVGRLVESPGQMRGLIDTYLAWNGQVDFRSPDDGALVTGFDFFYDSACTMFLAYDAVKTADALLDARLIDPPGPCVDVPWTPDDLVAGLFNGPPHTVSAVNIHANHFSFSASSGTPDYVTATTMAANPNSLEGTVLISSGCHAGLNVPPVGGNTYDLNELMTEKKVMAYIANTGYGWGLRYGSGLTEKLLEKVTEYLLSPQSVTVGEVLAAAKRRYLLEEKRYDIFDEKVLHQLTLFGIPNALILNRTARTSTTGWDLPAPDDERNAGCDRGVCMTKKLTADTRGIPPGMTRLELNYTFGEETYIRIDTVEDGSYYTLNGRSSGETGDTLQPHFVYDSAMSGTQSHGVIFTGGSYRWETPFDPVIAVPRSTNEDNGEGSMPRSSTYTPVMRYSNDKPGATKSKDALTVGSTTMVVHTGYFSDGGQYRFDDMQFTIFYSNDEDYTPPVISDPGPNGHHVLNGLRADFQVTVSDDSPLHLVLVTWENPRTAMWQSLELTDIDGDGTWTGSLDLKNDIVYFVQAVDIAGNAALFLDSDIDRDGEDNPYGSEWSGPLVWTITLVDDDEDGLPDYWEALYPCLSVPGNGNADSDPDYDYLTNMQEFMLDTNPCAGDSDGGGDNDGSEYNHGRDHADPYDDRQITIMPSTSGGGSVVITWHDNIPDSDNWLIDGQYFVYKSTKPSFSPTDRINPLPVPHCDNRPDCTVTDHQFPDTCEETLCYYQVWNHELTTPPPDLIAVSPDQGPEFVATDVNLFGSDFRQGATVSFRDVPATNVIVRNESWITCTTPALAAGPCTVKVINLNGQSDSLEGGYSFTSK